MKKGFFRSREFAISLFIASGCFALSFGAVVANTLGDNFSTAYFFDEGCDLDQPPGEADLATILADETRPSTGRFTRTQQVVADPPPDLENITGGRMELCTRVGALNVVGHDKDEIDIEYRVHADQGTGVHAAVRNIELSTWIRVDDGTLYITAGPTSGGYTSDSLFGRNAIEVAITVVVPASIAFDLGARAGVGDIDLDGLRLMRQHFSTNVGNIDGANLNATGSLVATTNIGNIDLGYDTFEPMGIAATTNVGDIDIMAQSRGKTAVAVDADASVGHVEIEIGPTSYSSQQQQGPSERVEQRSRDWNDADRRAEVVLRTNVGNIELRM